MLSLTDRLKLSAELVRTIDARREATSDQGIGSVVERGILDQELAELARMDDESAVAASPTPVANTLTTLDAGFVAAVLEGFEGTLDEVVERVASPELRADLAVLQTRISAIRVSIEPPEAET